MTSSELQQCSAAWEVLMETSMCDAEFVASEGVTCELSDVDARFMRDARIYRRMVK